MTTTKPTGAPTGGAPTGRPPMRWLVPVGLVAVIATIGLLTSVVTRITGGTLPARTAAQLIGDLATADTNGLSGTLAERADLGLPPLPGIGGDGSSDFSSMLDGPHTLRLWYTDPAHVRLALLGALGESDVIRNGPDAWIWSSTTNSATHATLPAGAPAPLPTSLLPTSLLPTSLLPTTLPTALPSGLPGALPTDPISMTKALMAAVGKSTSVRTGDPVTVAGRSAYQLVIAPKHAGSLVAGIHIAIDGARHLPLRVQVYATGQARPAFELGFTSITFDRPEARAFAFNPPPGVTVTEAHAGMPGPGTTAGPQGGTGGTDAARPAATVIGSDWTAVLAVRPPADTLARLTGTAGTGTTGAAGPTPTGGPRDGGLGPLFAQLPKVSGDWGSGRLLQTALVSVLITDDGRVFVGPVPGARLLLDAGTPAGALTGQTPHR
jgi:hypothetical protein